MPIPTPVPTPVPLPSETTPAPEQRVPAQSPTRTLLKSLTWQASGLVTTMLIAFALTGSLATGGVMALLSAAIGTVMFVLHERAWERIDWGRGPRFARPDR